MLSTHRQARDAPASKPTRTSRPAQDSQDDRDAINLIVDRMRGLVAPDPYVLTIPQDVEPRYHHSYQYQALQWLDHTPFGKGDREKLQYQTFQYYEHGSTMYVQESSREDDGKQEASSQPLSRITTGAGTPNIKKKISLNAYMRKQAGGTPLLDNKAQDSSSTKPSAVKDAAKRLKEESDQVLAGASDVDELTLPGDAKMLKRKSDAIADPEGRIAKRARTPPTDAQAATQQSAPRSMPSQKKVPSASIKRNDVSPSLATKPDRAATKQDRSLSPPARTSKLPPRLSPLHVPSMPSRISSAMPTGIKSLLKSRDQEKKPDRPPLNSTANEAKPKLAKSNDHGIAASPASTNGVRGRSRSPALVQKSAAKGPTANLRHASPAPHLSQDDEIVVSKSSKKKRLPPSSLVVFLKFSKHRCKAIDQILSTPPKPARVTSPNPSPEQGAHVSSPEGDAGKSSKAVPGKTIPTSKGIMPVKSSGAQKALPEKRVSDEKERHDDRPAKRTKTSEPAGHASKRPLTPMRPDQDSSSLTGSALKSSQLATPGARKDALSVAMRREQSSESHINTPSGHVAGTPVLSAAKSQSNGVTRPASGHGASQLSHRTPMQQAWETEQKRLERLGRELKHAATDHLQKPDSSSRPPTSPSSNTLDQKLAAVKSLESLLAYVLAFTCADEAARAADPPFTPSIRTWQTLQGFFKFVKSHCRRYPPLYGLTSCLGVVFTSRILSPQHLEGLSRDAMSDSLLVLHRAAADSEANLSLETIMTSFPQTWSRRSKMAGDACNKIDGPAKFSGPFSFPVGIHSTPIMAARACHAMLEEWMQKQGDLDYRLRTRLSS